MTEGVAAPAEDGECDSSHARVRAAWERVEL